MHLSPFLLAPLLAAVAAQAQTSAAASSPSSSAASSTSGVPFTHTISVAYAGFTFSPDVTLAEVGDIIEFDFYPTNHSVIRSEWGYPCIPYEDTGIDKVGFFSGFEPVDAILPDPPKYQITVNDTKPIFFYCGATGSCIKYGMVGVVNPNATTPIATQIAAAKNSTFMLLPGEPWPSESNDPFQTTSVGGSEATPSPTSSSSTSTSATATPAATTSAAAVAPTGHTGLSSGAIAGIAIGAAAVALVAAALLYLCGRQSRSSRGNYSHAPPQAYMSPAPHMSYIAPHPQQKHLSTTSGIYGSPALPGYIPQHDPAMSPPLQQAYPQTTSAVGSEAGGIASPGSPTPSNSNIGYAPAAPAYQQMPHHSMPIYPVAVPPQGVHEMDTQNNGGGQGGIMNFIRNASTRKSGGTVERYG